MDARTVTRDEAHNYWLTGKLDPLPSVTTILDAIAKPEVVPWAARRAIELAVDRYEHGWFERHGDMSLKNVVSRLESEAIGDRLREAEVGDRVHAMAEARLGGNELWAAYLEPHETGYGEAFTRWRDAFRGEIYATELVGADAECGYGGTLDAVGDDKQGEFDGLAVIDFKSGNLWPIYRLQVAAYGHMLWHSQGTDFDHGLLVHLRVDGSFREERFALSPLDLMAFYAAKSVYEWQRDNDKPWRGDYT